MRLADGAGSDAMRRVLAGAAGDEIVALSRRYSQAHSMWGGPETTGTGCPPAKRRLVRAPR